MTRPTLYNEVVELLQYTNWEWDGLLYLKVLHGKRAYTKLYDAGA